MHLLPAVVVWNHQLQVDRSSQAGVRLVQGYFWVQLVPLEVFHVESVVGHAVSALAVQRYGVAGCGSEEMLVAPQLLECEDPEPSALPFHGPWQLSLVVHHRVLALVGLSPPLEVAPYAQEEFLLCQEAAAQTLAGALLEQVALQEEAGA